MVASGPEPFRPLGTFSFVFPMWNEEAIIERTIAAACEAGDRLVLEGEVADYEIVVVDDASTDATGAIADRLAGELSNMRVVHHEQNRKLGGTLKTAVPSPSLAKLSTSARPVPARAITLIP